MADKMSPDRIASVKAGYILIPLLFYLQVDSYYFDVEARLNDLQSTDLGHGAGMMQKVIVT